MTTPETFTEDELLQYVRDTASDDLRDRVERATGSQPALNAEIALMRGIQNALAKDPDKPFAKDFGWQKLKTEINREQTPPAGRSPIWRIAAACLGVIVIGQAGYILSNAPSRSDATFETATTANTAEDVLVIAFAANTEVADIVVLLDAVDGKIIGGPNTIGMFRVAFGSDEDAISARAILSASDLVDLIADE